jgi:hypothetical protein
MSNIEKEVTSEFQQYKFEKENFVFEENNYKNAIIEDIKNTDIGEIFKVKDYKTPLYKKVINFFRNLI